MTSSDDLSPRRARSEARHAPQHVATRARRAALCGALVMATLAIGSGALAQPQPSAADLESARALFKQGKDLRATGKPEDLRAALDKFTAAHTYAATPLTGLELGRTQAQLGQLLEARETLLSVGRLKVQSDETEKSAAARTEAADLAEQLRARISGVNVRIQTTAPEGKTVLTIDGATVTIVAGSATRKVNPGAHTLVAKAGTGPEDQKTITLKEGETQDVVLVPTWSDAPAVVPATPPPPVTTPPPGGDAGSGGGTGRTLFYVGAAAGGIGVVMGTITGIVALSKASSLKDACPDKTACAAAGAKSDYDSGRTMGTISTISFVVAGAGAVTAVVGLLMGPGASSKTGGSGVKIVPQVGLGWAGVNGAF